MLKKLAHLRGWIGEKKFQALINSDNTVKVNKFCDSLIGGIFPTEMTVGGRTYDILGFLEAGETSISGSIMVNRSKEMNANLGKDDGKHILKYQNEIPASLWGKVIFVFTEWRHPVDHSYTGYVFWDNGYWTQSWDWIGLNTWSDYSRLLRRK